MTDLLLGMSFVAFFACGYLLMSRLDRYIFNANNPHATRDHR